MINPGILKHRISFYKKMTTIDSEGFKQSNDTLFLNTKCSVDKISDIDNNRSTSKKIDSKKELIYCTLRYHPEISKDCVAYFKNKRFKVVEIDNINFANKILKLVLRDE